MSEHIPTDGLFAYIVAYAGGLGPNVWDGEKIVQAKSVREALDQVEPSIIADGGEVFLVEQQ